MLPGVPQYINLLFALLTLVAVALFVAILRQSSMLETRKKAYKIGLLFSIWMFIQGITARSGFYAENLPNTPPRILLFGVLPFIPIFLILLLSEGGKKFTNSLSIKKLNHLHFIRIPVELFLYVLYLNEYIPKIMTFEGQNIDIFVGISTIIVVNFGFRKNKIKTNFVLTWNLLAGFSLINIVSTAILSAPTPFQQFGLEQPNIAILYFPYCWLPTVIVPIILFAHIISIKQILTKKTTI